MHPCYALGPSGQVELTYGPPPTWRASCPSATVETDSLDTVDRPRQPSPAVTAAPMSPGAARPKPVAGNLLGTATVLALSSGATLVVTGTVLDDAALVRVGAWALIAGLVAACADERPQTAPAA